MTARHRGPDPVFTRHRDLLSPPTLARFDIGPHDIKAPSGPGAARAYTWRGYWVAFILVGQTTYTWQEPPE